MCQVTGYILMVGNCPVQWVSKLQSKIAMLVEYIALSTAMRDLIVDENPPLPLTFDFLSFLDMIS